MADTTDILSLRIPSDDGSDPADLAQIIGDLGADVDSAVGNPALTTTQINALTGDAKSAGRRVWDSTLGVEKVSNGTTWEVSATRDYVQQVADDLAGAVPVHAIGTRASSLQLPHSQAIAVTWTAEVDPHGIVGGETFTLPSAGVYQVSACTDCVASDDEGAGYFVTQIVQNGSQVAYATTPRSPYGPQGVDGASAVSTTIVAAAGDTLQLRIWNAYTSGATACTFARMTVVRLGA